MCLTHVIVDNGFRMITDGNTSTYIIMPQEQDQGHNTRTSQVKNSFQTLGVLCYMVLTTRLSIDQLHSLSNMVSTVPADFIFSGRFFWHRFLAGSEISGFLAHAIFLLPPWCSIALATRSCLSDGCQAICYRGFPQH